MLYDAIALLLLLLLLTTQHPLHNIVVGPATSLWHGPFNVLLGVLDAAGLAVQAVLRVDGQHLPPTLLVSDVLVHTSWAVPAGGDGERLLNTLMCAMS